MNIKQRYAKEWSPSLISFIVKRRCYTGHHAYKIGYYRELISHSETEIHRLEGMLEQTAIGRQTKEAAIRILESLRDANLENASSDEKCNLMAQLGIKVYPSEDAKVIRIASTLRFAPSPLDFSPQKISIASPKL